MSYLLLFQELLSLSLSHIDVIGLVPAHAVGTLDAKLNTENGAA